MDLEKTMATPAPMEGAESTIEIVCHADGTYTVSKESAGQESMEPAGSEADEGNGQTAASPEEALKLVADMLMNKGNAMAEQEKGFNEGFDSNQGSGSSY